jgi:ubiquinone/menaquinone biosynthesis C-methylase UbiE
MRNRTSSLILTKKLGLLYTNFVANIGKSPGGTVLELASGSGNLTLSLLHSGHFGHVVASDISPDFMEILSRRYDRNPSDARLDRFLFDANALPFSDNQFAFIK